MIRPEAAAFLHRWRDALIGLGLLALGVYWGFFTGGGLLHWIGYGLIAGGLAACAAGLQRARFPRGTGGPGVVQVVEGRIAYFGPLSGGVADLDAMSTLTFDPRATPPHWLLAQPGQPPLAIPVNAEGAETLFDAFAHLPGLRTGALVEATRSAEVPVKVWQREGKGVVARGSGSPNRDAPRRLH